MSNAARERGCRGAAVDGGGRIHFATAEDARVSGYRPCRICTPDSPPPAVPITPAP